LDEGREYVFLHFFYTNGYFLREGSVNFDIYLGRGHYVQIAKGRLKILSCGVEIIKNS